jgi:hypothetical protein
MNSLNGQYLLCMKKVSSEVIKSLHCPAPASNFLKHIASDLFDLKETSARAALDGNLALECRPSTQNHYIHDILLKLRVEPMMRAIRDLGTDSVFLNAVIAVMKNFGVGELSNDDREAMDMELYLKAYLKVAKKRFIDNVPMLLELHLVRPYMAEVKAKI